MSDIMAEEPKHHYPTPETERLRRDMMKDINSLYTK